MARQSEVQPPLRGRAAETAALASVLAAARAGDGAALILVGATGTGKSALLSAAAAEADGFLVLATSGSPNETDLPYAGLRRLLDPVTGEETSPAGALALLRQQERILVIVDDVHHLDRASADTLSYLARRLDNTAIGMVLALDPADGGDVLDRTIPRRTLPPLDERAGRALLDDLSPGGLAGDVADALVAIAAGNPLALVDLARSLTPEQVRGEQAPPVTLPPGSRLRAAHRDRLSALPPAARWLTLLVAADEELTTHELADAARHPRPTCAHWTRPWRPGSSASMRTAYS
ncbi:AAA family ATPase [Luedemannella flava]